MPNERPKQLFKFNWSESSLVEHLYTRFSKPEIYNSSILYRLISHNSANRFSQMLPAGIRCRQGIIGTVLIGQSDMQ